MAKAALPWSVKRTSNCRERKKITTNKIKNTYHMTSKIFSIAITLVSLLCFSCSETDMDNELSPNTPPSTHASTTYDVDIEAQTNAPERQHASAKPFDMSFKVSEENIGGKTVMYPKLNITQKLIPSLVVLYDKKNNRKEIVEANWKVVKKGTDVKLILEKLSLKSNIADGEWYLMSMIGGGEKKGDNLEVNTETAINVVEKDQEFTTSCPFATTWRRIVKNGNQIKLDNKNKKMVFKPQGVFLMVWVENRTTLDTRLRREITMESNAFCASGAYKFNINKDQIAEDADLASSYWEPNSANAIKGLSSVYEKYNAKQYATTIKLNYQDGKDDGTLRQGKSDLNNYIYFNSYKKPATGVTAATNTKTTRGFLVCLMPVDYKKTSNYDGIEGETLFYGKVDVTTPNRKNFTYDSSIYGTAGKSDPNTWCPYMGNRYLLGSFSNKLEKGTCYKMRLRIVRPMLPIERLWAYRQDEKMEKRNYNNAKGIAEGTKEDKTNYPALDSKLYRLPKYSEFVPIFNNPKLQLDNGKGLGGIGPFDAGEGYGNHITMGSHRHFVDINGKQNKFDNWLCSVPGSNVLYGIMYIKPYGDRDKSATNNYKVAVRMTFPDATANKGVATIDVYYLGPNYNISVNNAGYYLAHEDFWRRLKKEDIIQRKFQLGPHWLDYKNATHPQEPKAYYADFSLSGVAQEDNDKPGRILDFKFFLPWLKSPAW